MLMTQITPNTYNIRRSTSQGRMFACPRSKRWREKNTVVDNFTLKETQPPVGRDKIGVLGFPGDIIHSANFGFDPFTALRLAKGQNWPFPSHNNIAMCYGLSCLHGRDHRHKFQVWTICTCTTCAYEPHNVIKVVTSLNWDRLDRLRSALSSFSSDL
jgi:hypothetical protein